MYKKYWLQLGTRRVFATHLRGDDEAERTLALYQVASMKIIRHVKVVGAYNPFDAKWELYGEQRYSALMSEGIVEEDRCKLWLQQGGYCPVCETLLDGAADCDEHHIVYRMHGGSHALANRVLLHPVCHRRVHALGLKVTKPAPAPGA